MGLLVDGQWQDQWYDTKTNGAFQRTNAQFRHQLDTPEYPAEPNRYRLYVSLACPWAHRILIVRALKKLEPLLPISIVHWHMADQGWTFQPGQGVIPDPEGAQHLHEIYTRTDPAITTRVTVPILYDTHRQTIVNNESADIIRMLNHGFDPHGAAPGDYYPHPLRPEIDAYNHRIYETLNNGVYKAGFATTQHAYDAAIHPLFATLDWLESHLARRRYLCGATLTEADIRLFTTLVRFDAVYVGHFKCNIRRLVDYPALWAYTRDLYAHPGFAETTDFHHIKGHYYMSHPTINPHAIVPAGPEIDWNAPHLRASLSTPNQVYA